MWVRHVSDVYKRATSTKVFWSGGVSLWGMSLDGYFLGSLGFWPPINMGPQTFWDSFGRFLSLRFSLLSPLSLCILQSPITVVVLPYDSFSLTVLAFCTTATPVAVHFSSDSTTFPSFGSGWLSFYQQCFF